MSRLFLPTLLIAIVASLLGPFSLFPVVILLLGVTLLSTGASGWRPKRGIDVMLLGWLIWLPLTLFWSMSIGQALQWVGILSLLPLAYLAWRLVSAYSWAQLALQAILWILLLLLMFWGLIQGPDTNSAKPQGPFNDPNTYAGILILLAMPLLAHYLASNLATLPRWNRTLQLTLLGGAALVFFLVASRGATLSMLLTLPVLLWVARSQADFIRKLLLLLTVAVTSYGFALWSTAGFGNVVQRLANTLHSGDSSRLMLFRSALDMIADHPWLGNGLGSFRLLYPSYRLPEEAGTGGGWVHNDYLQLWLEGGLPMLVLLLALVGWVAWAMWRNARAVKVDNDALVRFGYLSGMMAVFIQANVNFMFYFAFISLFLGLYLGRASRLQVGAAAVQPMPRAWRMAVVGYGAILAYLFAGHVAVVSLLNPMSYATRALAQVLPATSRYEVAHWLSVLVPFQPVPSQVKGQELVKMLDVMTGAPAVQADMLQEAIGSMTTSQRLAPCYVPYGIEMLDMLVRFGQGAADIDRAKQQVAINLACNPRHGTTYYYAGLLHEKAGDKQAALRVWQAGLPQMVFFADRLLLSTVILSRTTPGQAKALGELAGQMVDIAHHMETHPNTQMDGQFWLQAQYQLIAANEAEYLKLVAQFGK